MNEHRLRNVGRTKINLTGIILILVLGSFGCQSQMKKQMTEKNNNPVLCDPEKGICEIVTTDSASHEHTLTELKKPVKIIYFTDPICSSCWGIEPQLRKLKLEYGTSIEIEYRMGGLLKDWSYNSGGISKPSDVAHHWDEVSAYYDMPIDGDVWLEDPLSSSYPPSIAFKAAQMQDEVKAIKFLRRIREMVFLEKKNITKWEHLSTAGSEVGLDTIKLKTDYEGRAQELFQTDLELAKSMGVRGFPTLFFRDSLNNQQVVYGFRPYETFEESVLKSFPNAVKTNYDTSWETLFSTHPTLTTREFSELSGLAKQECETLLQDLVDLKELKTISTKNGILWVRRS